jgi:hypothetical protein
MDLRTNNPLPFDGPVVLARIYSQPLKYDSRVWINVGAGTSVYFLLTFAVTINAIFHRQFLYLAFIAVGISVWQSGFWYMKRLISQIRKRRMQRVDRDESDMTTVTRLKELTNLQAFGRFIPGKGGRAWLTDNGVYFDNGSYLPWEWFQSYGIEVPEKGTHRILLRYFMPGGYEGNFKGEIRAFAAKVSFFMIPASCIFLIGGLMGCRAVGMRWDVLANFLSILLPLPVVAVLFALSNQSWSHKPGEDLIAIVDEGSIPMEMITELLQKRVAMNP